LASIHRTQQGDGIHVIAAGNASYVSWANHNHYWARRCDRSGKRTNNSGH